MVDRPELWPHETPDIWAIPAEDLLKGTQRSVSSGRSSGTLDGDSLNNNLTAVLPPKGRTHTDSHSSVELEWENEEGTVVSCSTMLSSYLLSDKCPDARYMAPGKICSDPLYIKYVWIWAGFHL